MSTIAPTHADTSWQVASPTIGSVTPAVQCLSAKHRAARIFELPLECMHNKEFDQPLADQSILALVPGVGPTRKPHRPTAADQFFDLVSDGNMSLFRAVEKFDYSLGNKFGMCWQVVPSQLQRRLESDDAQATQRMFEALWQMKKLDIAKLQKAFDGVE